MLDIKFPDIPKGQTTSYIIFILCGFFTVLAYRSQNNIFGYVFLGMSLSSYLLGIFVFAGFIPCKERVLKDEIKISSTPKKPPKRGKKQ